MDKFRNTKMSRYFTFIALCALFAQINLCSGVNSCWAPPFVWGRPCSSSRSIFGSPGYTVRYSVTVLGNAGTLVCCQGYSPASSSYVYIGCGYSTFSRNVGWGNNLATPKIKCKGTPFGASVTWSP